MKQASCVERSIDNEIVFFVKKIKCKKRKKKQAMADNSGEDHHHQTNNGKPRMSISEPAGDGPIVAEPGTTTTGTKVIFVIVYLFDFFFL